MRTEIKSSRRQKSARDKGRRSRMVRLFRQRTCTLELVLQGSRLPSELAVCYASTKVSNEIFRLYFIEAPALVQEPFSRVPSPVIPA
jgi:hypothetical protein